MKDHRQTGVIGRSLALLKRIAPSCFGLIFAFLTPLAAQGGSLVSGNAPSRPYISVAYGIAGDARGATYRPPSIWHPTSETENSWKNPNYRKTPSTKYTPSWRVDPGYTGYSGYYGSYGDGTAGKTSNEAGGDKNPLPRGNGETLLLVDHENSTRSRMAASLRQLGYRVLEAENGIAALAMLRSRLAIDLLLTEVKFPSGPSGARIARAARASNPNLKLLYFSGFGSGQYRPRPGTTRTTSIRKPYKFAELAGKVRNVINGTVQ